MGKQSRRIRKHTAPVKQQTAPVKQQTAVKRQRTTLKLDRNNAEDMRILDTLKTSQKYIPLIHEDIREPNDGDKITMKDYYKFKLREIRQQQAMYIYQNTNTLLTIYTHMKIGKTPKENLDIYFDDLNSKTSLINFLTHLHNGNTDKASHYYIKWRNIMSNRLDQLLFDDCSDEYVEVDGKRINADTDEAVRLLGEQIQEDVDFYKKVWRVLIGTAFPVC